MFKTVIAITPLLIGLGTMAFAGMDFTKFDMAMTNGYVIRDFTSAQEAIRFANDVKGSQEIQKALMKRLNELFSQSGHVKFLDPNAEKILAKYKQQVNWVGLASQTIQNYIDHGVGPDMAQIARLEDVGADFYAGEMPINRGAVR